MSRQLDGVGNWAFFDARTSASEELELRREVWRGLNARMLAPSEIGIYASHMALWREHLDRPAQSILIVLEDDTLVDTHFLRDPEAIERWTLRHHYVRLNGQYWANGRIVDRIGRKFLVRHANLVLGACGYMLTPLGASRLYKGARAVRRPIDIEMDRYWAHGLPILSVHQPPVIEQAMPSQVTGRGFDFANQTPAQRLRYYCELGERKIGRAIMNARYALFGLG